MKSLRYKTDEELGMPFKSYAEIDLKSHVTKVDIYTQNLQWFSEDWTFRVIVEEQENTTSVVTIVMLTISICIMCVLLSVCFFRCFINARQDSDLIDW